MAISSDSAGAPAKQENDWLKLLRQLLRDREALLGRIFDGGESGRISAKLLGLNAAALGVYGLVVGMSGRNPQWIYSAIKLPIVYLLTLAVCFPLLFVINILMGSRLGVRQTFALMLAAMGLNALLLAASVPIAFFFVASGADYHFMKLLHAALLGLGGLWAIAALYGAIVEMCEHSAVYPRRALRILLVWMVIFGFVGTQMAWVLRPFLGAPQYDPEFLRSNRTSTVYQNLWDSVKSLGEEPAK